MNDIDQMGETDGTSGTAKAIAGLTLLFTLIAIVICQLLCVDFLLRIALAPVTALAGAVLLALLGLANGPRLRDVGLWFAFVVAAAVVIYVGFPLSWAVLPQCKGGLGGWI